MVYSAFLSRPVAVPSTSRLNNAVSAQSGLRLRSAQTGVVLRSAQIGGAQTGVGLRSAQIGGLREPDTPDAPADYTPRDSASACQCITDAFYDDPLMRFLIPDDDAYRRHMPFFNRCLLWALQGYSMCDVIRTPETRQTVALGVWEPASMTFAGGLRFFAVFVLLLFRMGPRDCLRFGRLAMTLEAKRHKHAPTAHHLQTLSTDPGYQGRGLGGKVILQGLARATAQGVPAYLESSNPKNVPFYKRHGFQVLEEFYPFATGADKGPLVTLMFRPLPGPRHDDEV